MPTLNWIGKDAVVKHHKDVPFRLLEPVAELSCGPADTGNLIVQGDNLHALKALLPRYAGQVKCIYSDPPYNSSILDNFAGSGTTGHAVLALNAEDGGNRRFILAEIDKEIAYTVTAERLRRASNGYIDSKGNGVDGLGSGFQFCHLSSEPLFTAEGQIRPDVSFTQLAEFVWFSETGSGYLGKGDSPLLGVHEGRAIYLLYNGILKDKSIAGGNVLTGPVFDLLPKFAGPKVIYAAANRMGGRAGHEGVTFKQTPYALEV